MIFKNISNFPLVGLSFLTLLLSVAVFFLLDLGTMQNWSRKCCRKQGVEDERFWFYQNGCRSSEATSSRVAVQGCLRRSKLRVQHVISFDNHENQE